MTFMLPLTLTTRIWLNKSFKIPAKTILTVERINSIFVYRIPNTHTDLVWSLCIQLSPRQPNPVPSKARLVHGCPWKLQEQKINVQVQSIKAKCSMLSFKICSKLSFIYIVELVQSARIKRTIFPDPFSLYD